MKPHQERVVAEKFELDERREKLRVFIGGDAFSEVNKDERNRLISQLSLMSQLSTVLGERIAAFEA